MTARSVTIEWISRTGTQSVKITREDGPNETPEQGREATKREAESFARRCGWVPLSEETPRRRLSRWLAGDRQ